MPLKVSDGIAAWIKDFQKSDAPQFKGKSDKERQAQAVAAYLSAKRGDTKEDVNEDMTFKVEVEGLPALFIAGNSPGQVKNHLRKLIKQPSMIKSVERQTKHDVKKMYRKKAQGKNIDESKSEPEREYDYEGEMTKQQLRTIEMASKELQSMISDNQNLPEWWQNKITLAADYMQTARDYMKSDVKEGTVNELSPDTVKSYKKAASKSNYSAAQKYARVAASPTGRKYKNKEMGKQDDIMRKRKAGLAMADKKKVDEQLDERTPIKPVVVDRKQKNLKVPNPNYKGQLRRKEKKQRDLYKEGSCGEVDYGSDKSIKIMKKKTPGETNEKITLAKVRGALYKTAKAMGDVQAVRKKKVGKRVARRVAGKAASKVLRNLIK